MVHAETRRRGVRGEARNKQGFSPLGQVGRVFRDSVQARTFGSRTSGVEGGLPRALPVTVQLGSGTRQGPPFAFDSAGGCPAMAGIKFIQYVKERVRPRPGRAGGPARPSQASPRLVLAWDRAIRIPLGGI